MLRFLGAKRNGRLDRNAKRLSPFTLQQGSRGAQGSLRLIVGNGFDEDKVSAGAENRANLRCLRYERNGNRRIPLLSIGLAAVALQNQGGSTRIVKIHDKLVEQLLFH